MPCTAFSCHKVARREHQPVINARADRQEARLARRHDLDPTSAGNLSRASAAELVGTFLLVLVGTSVAVSAALNRPIAGTALDSLAVPLAFGLTLVALVALVGALGQVSGAHVNPAVTMGLASARKFPWSSVPYNVVARLIGTVLAPLAVWASYGDAAGAVAKLAATAPASGISTGQTLLVEAAATFLVVFVVIAVATDPRVPAGTASLAIGLALAGGILYSGPATGAGINPARVLAPMIVANTWDSWWVYVVGTIAGGVIAALLYSTFIGQASPPSLPVADQYQDDQETSANERIDPDASVIGR